MRKQPFQRFAHWIADKDDEKDVEADAVGFEEEDLADGGAGAAEEGAEQEDAEGEGGGLAVVVQTDDVGDDRIGRG